MKFITQVNYLFALTSNIKQWNLAAILKICIILFNSYINNDLFITKCVYGQITCLVKDTYVQPI